MDHLTTLLFPVLLAPGSLLRHPISHLHSARLCDVGKRWKKRKEYGSIRCFFHAGTKEDSRTTRDPIQKIFRGLNRSAKIKVISSLILNIISSLFGVAAIFLFGFNYIFLGSGDLFCVTYEWNSKCEGYFHLNVLVGGVVTMQLLFVFLMFCISMSTSVFACKTLCRNSFQGESVVIYQTIPVPTDPNTTKDFPSVPESYDATLMPQEGDR